MTLPLRQSLQTLSPDVQESGSAHVRWPAERFFWSVLEAPGLSASYTGPVPEGVLTLLADDLPIPLEDVHAVGLAIGPGRLLVCAARRSDLEVLPPGALSLTPESVPAFAEALVVESGDADVTALNLLIGEFEPAAIRRARARTHLIAAATVAIASMLAALGLARRAEILSRDAEAARQASTSLVRGWVVDPTGDAFALQRELQRIREAHTQTQTIAVPIDVAPVLTETLLGWPTELAAEAQSIALAPSTLSLSVLLDESVEPARFLQALRPPAGWRIDEQRHANVGPGRETGAQTRLSIRLKPSIPAAGGMP
jgi:hypothetical protein